MATNIKARRRLSDLYKRGVEVRFGADSDGRPYGRVAPEGEGYFLGEDGKPLPLGPDEVAAWVQSPSPLQREMALRDAQASRARALVRARRDKDSPEHLTSLAFLVEMEDVTLIEYVLVSTADERRQDAMREVLAEDEWKDISDYQDAFRQFDEGYSDEDLAANEEYQALLELDAKLGEQVDARAMELYTAEHESLVMKGREKVEKEALERRIEIAASQSFMAEYERQMMFFSVRDIDDHGQLFFESARESAEQEDDIRQVFAEALERFISDVGEAKNSPRAASGSQPSELPTKLETSESSTPETVSV